MLAAHTERFATRHQNLELRANLEEIRDTFGGIDDVLEVVEEQQHVAGR